MIRISYDRKTLKEIGREEIGPEEADLSALAEVLAEDFLRKYKKEADFLKSDNAETEGQVKSDGGTQSQDCIKTTQKK